MSDKFKKSLFQEVKGNKAFITKQAEQSEIDAVSQLLDQSLDVNEGISAEESTIIKGEVVAVYKKLGYALVRAEGLRSEAYVSLGEFVKNNQEMQVEVGTEHEFCVISTNPVQLSLSAVINEYSWASLKMCEETGEYLATGLVTQIIRGGFIVDFNGIIAFVPRSHMDIKTIETQEEMKSYIGKSYQFVVMSMDSDSSAVIVSRKLALQSINYIEKRKFIEGIEKGQVLKGLVKNIKEYGAFVAVISEYNGETIELVDGLLHISDITWSKVNHPSEILTEGQVVDVQVTDIDKENARLSFGMKQLVANPWDEFSSKYKAGDVIKGKLSAKTDYGIFVTIDQDNMGNKIDGLVHNNEIAWNKALTDEFKAKVEKGEIKEGYEIEAKILEINLDKHRISLTIKGCEENPYEAIEKQYNKGDKVKVTVQNILTYGMFTSINDKVSALIHISDLVWSGNGEEKLRSYSVGDEIEAVYMSANIEKGRVALSIKDLTENPFAVNESKLAKGNTVTTTVVATYGNSIVVSLCDGQITTTIDREELAKDKEDQRTNRFTIGEKVDAVVTYLDTEKGKISLSIAELQRKAHKSILNKYGSTKSGSTLGSIIGSELEINEEEDTKEV